MHDLMAQHDYNDSCCEKHATKKTKQMTNSSSRSNMWDHGGEGSYGYSTCKDKWPKGSAIGIE